MEEDKTFEKIYSCYYELIYKYCLSRLKCNRELAEDTVQDTFLVLYNKIRDGEIIKNERAFLYKTSTNFIKKNYNRHKNEYTFSDAAELEQHDAFRDSIIEKINFEEFENELDRLLDDNEKALYNMRFVNGERVKDIALKLNLEEHHCSVKISRLRKKIVKNLSEYY